MNEFLAARTGFVLLAPQFLLLALALPLAWAWRARRPPPAIRFAPAPLLAGAPLPRSLRQRLRLAPDALQALGLLLLAVALARPAERVALPRRSLGADLMLALDRSSSMLAQDLDPARARLELAQELARRFVAGRAGDRIGLIAFARFPDLLCAPTLDHGALAERLAGWGAVEPDGPEDLTGIGGAVARAAEILRRAPGPAKVIVLLTDGEENVAGAHAPQAIGPAEAAELCRAWGVRVHLIVTGAAAEAGGGDVRALAEATGGTHHRAADAAALARIWEAIGALEPAPLEEPRVLLRGRAAWPAGAAAALMALAALWRRRYGAVLP